MKILRRIGRFALRHPVWSGFGIEAGMVLLFFLFPFESHHGSLVGMPILCLHIPAFFVVGRLLDVPLSTGLIIGAIGFAALMWTWLLMLIRRFLASRLLRRWKEWEPSL